MLPAAVRWARQRGNQPSACTISTQLSHTTRGFGFMPAHVLAFLCPILRRQHVRGQRLRVHMALLLLHTAFSAMGAHCH
jgi:hypothetical protein